MNMQPATAPTTTPTDAQATNVRATSGTSVDAWRSLSVSDLKSDADRVLFLVGKARINGAADVTIGELQALWTEHYGFRPEKSSLSGTIGRLVTARKLVKDKPERGCTVSRKRDGTPSQAVAFHLAPTQGGFL